MDTWIWTVLIFILTFVLYKYHQLKNYFKQWGVPQINEIPFIGAFGAGFFLKRHQSVIMKKIYDVNKEAKYIGAHVFVSPVIVVRDCDVVKSILVKNFDHFADRKVFVEENVEPLLGKNLFFLNGDRWRDVRHLLSPSFTSSKMRSMFVLISDCADNFVKNFLKLHGNDEAIDIKNVFSKFTIDVIGTCAFGIEINSLADPHNEFHIRGKRSTNFTGIVLFKFILLRLFPFLASKIRILQKEDADFLINVIETAIKTRDENGITRPDMLQLMMDARESKHLNILEITAQAFVFFLGGFEATSSQMSIIAYELATHPEVQKKLQDEIDQVMEESNGKPSYEAVNHMAYMDAVFNECMRLHCLPMLSRICSKEFELPPAVPGGKPFIMKPGMEIFIPAAAIQRDPKYFENPDTFYPERYLDKKAMNDATELGFGIGPRMCIGNRFAILEIKVFFIHLLAKCSVVTCKETITPLQYEPRNFAPLPKGGCRLAVKPRN